MLYAQVGQHHLARTTETSLEPNPGTLSCLSARPHDLAFWMGTRPRVVGVSPSIVPFVYSKRAAAARSPGSRYRRWRAVARPSTRARCSSALNRVMGINRAKPRSSEP